MDNIPWADVPAWALVGIVVLGLAQLSLQVLAVLSVLRTPEERLVTGRRWVWILVIVLGWIGLIAYFAVARRPLVQEDAAYTPSAPDPPPDAKAQRAADLLYGSSPDNKDRRPGR